MRWLTAGESHGPALVGIIEGLPANIAITTACTTGTHNIGYGARTIAYGDLLSVLPQADWLILCCPASPQTRGLANGKVFAAMPDGSHFINVARGEVAVEADVIAALQSGKLAGAYLDVFEKEPLDPASPLWDLPNVLISPHTASHSQGQNEAIFEIFLENLARFRAGQELRNDVDALH